MVVHRKSCVLLPTIVVDNNSVVEIAQVAIASQLLFVRSRKVASVRSTYEVHAFYFKQLLIIDNPQLEVASLRAP